MTKEDYSLFWWSRRTGKQTRPRSRDYLLLRDWDEKYCVGWWPEGDARAEVVAREWHELLREREAETYASALAREAPIVDAALQHHPLVVQGAVSAYSATLTADELKRYKDRLRDRVRVTLSRLMARRLDEDCEFRLGFPSQLSRESLKQRASSAAHEVLKAAITTLARNPLEHLRGFVRARSDEEILDGVSRAREEWSMRGEKPPERPIDATSARRLLSELSNGQKASDALTDFLSEEGGQEFVWRRALELLALSAPSRGRELRWGLPSEWESALEHEIRARQGEMFRRSFRGRGPDAEDLAQQSTEGLIGRLREHAVQEYLCGHCPDQGQLERWSRVSASHISRAVAREHDHGRSAGASHSSREDEPEKLPNIVPEIQKVAAGRRRLFPREVEHDAINSWTHFVAIGKQPESRQEIEQTIKGLLSSDREGPDTDPVARVMLLVNMALTLWGTQRISSAEHQAAEEF